MSTRREVLVAGAAIASGLLAGCSGGDGGDKPSGGSVEVKKADVPVGGGLVLKEAVAVVTQPEEGTFLAFTAKCTHAGCIVKDVRPEGIYCACHGSTFNPNDGQPVAGPATEPLTTLTIHDSGDSLTVDL